MEAGEEDRFKMLTKHCLSNTGCLEDRVQENASDDENLCISW